MGRWLCGCLWMVLGVAATHEAAVAATTSETAHADIRYELQADRMIIRGAGQSQVEYVFRDEQILRPYFSNMVTSNGERLTRRHPPEDGQDATDHATMHPGFWLGLGDVNGEDFWRNHGRIEHVRFVEPPETRDGQVTFVAESRLRRMSGDVLGGLVDRCTIAVREEGWLIVWDATFTPEDEPLVFGDQEEMGFGVRVATNLTEKQGGIIRSSKGLQTAAATWGQEASWCDYSRTIAGRQIGVTLMIDPHTFRPAWWHNRDYGVFVANPFGRAAMKQGAPSRVVIVPGQMLRIVGGVRGYARREVTIADHYEDFLRACKQ